MEIDKPCACSFLCCNRPYAEVYLVEDRKRDLIGKIELPCSLCAHELAIKDPQDNDKFRIVGSCC